MEKQLVEFSLVVLANDHNPTILNPDFLKNTEIVMDEWNWKAVGQPITTPAFSTVQYDSNVVITVEPLKLQITDKSGSDITQSHICKAMSNYVRVLPFVNYSALGINFTVITRLDNASDFLLSRFLKDGEWNNSNSQLKSAGFKFSYSIDDGNVVLTIDKGIRSEEKNPFIVTQANFHRDLLEGESAMHEKIIKYLDNIEEDWKKFQQIHAAAIES